MLNKPWIDPRNVDWTDSLNPLAQSFWRWDVNPWFDQTMRDPLWQAIRSARNLEPRLLVAPDIGGLDTLMTSILAPGQTVNTSFTQMEPNSVVAGVRVNTNGNGCYLQITDSETGKTLFDQPLFFPASAGTGPILLATPWGFVPPAYPIVQLINADNVKPDSKAGCPVHSGGNGPAAMSSTKGQRPTENPHNKTMLVCQILARQRGSESPVDFARKNAHCLLARLHIQTTARLSPAQFVNDGLGLLFLRSRTSKRRTRPRRNAQFACRLTLPDQLFLCLLQNHQSVSVPLGHGENSLFVHLPSVISSRGHFYVAQRGHSYVAATAVGSGLTGTMATDRFCAVSFAVLVLTSSLFLAYLTEPAFDVASIKPGAVARGGGEGSRSERVDASPTGVTFYNTSLSSCIQWAYDVRSYQVSGPDWLVQDRFDIVARNEQSATKEKLRLMVQSLLADRFHLRLHREARTLPYYALIARQNAVKLPKSGADRDYPTQVVDGSFVFQHVTMREFAERLSRLAAIDRPVLDNTRIEGIFDITLKSAARQMLEDPTSIFVAVEKIGLELESRKGPFDVLMVDHADRPIPN